MLRSAIQILLSILHLGTGRPQLFRQKLFNAANFADAVNHFVMLGETAAIWELRRLSRRSHTHFIIAGWSMNERIGWMCRVLFTSNETQPLRPPGFGFLGLPYQTMPLASWPLFPVALAGSTYFVLSEGYNLFGSEEDPKEYIEYCRQHGTFRRASVPVPTRQQALTDLTSLHQSKHWAEIKWEHQDVHEAYAVSEQRVWLYIRKQAHEIP